jgi:hypothetical protein
MPALPWKTEKEAAGIFRRQPAGARLPVTLGWVH